MISTEIAVLCALLRLSRLSRRRSSGSSGGATLTDLVATVARTSRRRSSDIAPSLTDVQRALGSLARAQLVQRTGEHARLSLPGLAVALAAARHVQESSRAKPVAQPRIGRVVPMIRRARARSAA